MKLVLADERGAQKPKPLNFSRSARTWAHGAGFEPVTSARNRNQRGSGVTGPGLRHCPETVHVAPSEHVPQEPPHPSAPHCLPPQLGVQVGELENRFDVGMT